MLTQQDSFYLCLPNLSMREIFVEYFNQIHGIDVSTRYTAIMQAFVNQPNLEQLFAGYWREYIGQFPEAIFTQVTRISIAAPSLNCAVATFPSGLRGM